VETNENNEILFIDKIKRAARSGVHSNAGCAFNRTPACVHSSDVRLAAVASQCHMCSSVGICVRTYCVRLQITALKSRGASKLAMVAKAMWTSRADKECIQT
jgi:predicted transcriptional regulator